MRNPHIQLLKAHPLWPKAYWTYTACGDKWLDAMAATFCYRLNRKRGMAPW